MQLQGVGVASVEAVVIGRQADECKIQTTLVDYYVEWFLMSSLLGMTRYEGFVKKVKACQCMKGLERFSD